MRSDEQAIRDVFNDWQQASAIGDVSKLRDLMAEDVVFLLPGQPPMQGRETFIEAFESGLQKIRIQSSGEIQEIHVSGPLAYCWSHLSVNITPLAGGQPKRRSGYVLTILRKQPAGNWVVIRDANMLTESA